MTVSQTTYHTQGDEALCALAASGDRRAEEVLIGRYTRMVRALSRPLFLMGGDSEDLIQEGMLGLWKAVRDYVPDRGASFRTFAQTCVKNSMISAIKAAAGKHHIPLNDSVPFETLLFDRNDQLAVSDPETLYIDREIYSEQLDQFYSKLSGFEAKVLDLYLNGLSYLEISDQVNRSPKSVDNAVQRIRRKFSQQR
ncbi:MAG: sigma-70 family RNA polymerase sigma factor [Candidatus Onthomonas sp.]|nr:sigma-70 family RNA polymerase sigma factor [Candidatus Onthomonas sp.]